MLKAGRTRKAKICCRAITNGVTSVGGREKKHIVLLPLDVPLSSSMRIIFRPAILDQTLMKDS